jgi:hypothetical protein
MEAHAEREQFPLATADDAFIWLIPSETVTPSS